MMPASWRTTTLGVCTIVGALIAAVSAFVDGDPKTNPDWGTVIAAVTAGWGLIMARDNKVTSEQAGAK